MSVVFLVLLDNVSEGYNTIKNINIFMFLYNK